MVSCAALSSVWLENRPRRANDRLASSRTTSGWRAEYDLLRVAYYTDARQQDERKLPATERTTGFDEVVASLDPDAARYEAQRCYSCGNCFECDGCLAACPEDAIGKLGRGRGYRFDYTRCTGCAVCFEQCPCYAIDLIPEPGTTSAQGAKHE